jgi:hypothetical protein
LRPRTQAAYKLAITVGIKMATAVWLPGPIFLFNFASPLPEMNRTP